VGQGNLRKYTKIDRKIGCVNDPLKLSGFFVEVIGSLLKTHSKLKLKKNEK
jgi:hypothetical protein